MADLESASPRTSGWTFTGTPSSQGPLSETVTIVEGSAFCISGTSGDVVPGFAHGLFVRDTRVLSCWQLLVDGDRTEPLSHVLGDPFAATFIGRVRPRDGRADSALLVLRARYVGHGMREDVTIRNLGPDPVTCRLQLAIEADFADLFEVKESRVRAHGVHSATTEPGAVMFQRTWRDDTVGVQVSAPGWAYDPTSGLSIDVTVPGRSEWSSTVQLQPVVDGSTGPVDYPSGVPVEHAEPSRRLERWRRDIPVLHVDDADFRHLVSRSEEDLGTLRISDPPHPDRVAVAAGAPWFMTVFGRDSLLTAWMALPLDQTLAVGTLRTLAALQGREVDPRTDEEPGRIMHEIRHGMDSVRAGEDANVYYGSIDSTPLFVMLVGELHRWGVSADVLAELRPAVDRAIEWIETYGDRDGDGYVEYLRRSPQGLLNQGWKDSFDGVTFRDGRMAEPAIALAEVQGYCYAAYLAHADLADRSGDVAVAERSRARAAALRLAFNQDFWMPDQGYFALALDADKTPVDSVTSNIGHCLWTGIIDGDKAALVAGRLVSPDMFTGWGVRTLASSMVAYNPMSYHNGSVWPHDTAIVVAGLARYGFVDQARTIARGLLAAGAAFSGRLPELFCGFDRGDFHDPIPYPTSCSPQAWAAASPLLLLRSLLRLDPSVPDAELWVAPIDVPELRGLQLEKVPLAGERITVSLTDAGPQVAGLPAGLTLQRAPRATHHDDPALL